jgi:hypothetical protein
MTQDGYAKIVRAYDSRRRLIESAETDAEGRPVLSDDIGVKKLFTYDDWDRVVAVAYLDGEGDPIPVEVEVVAVSPGSTAERIGLAPADRLIEYNGEILTSLQQLIALTGMGGPHLRTLVVRRGSNTLTFQVPPGRIGVEIKNVKAQPAVRTGMIRFKERGRHWIEFSLAQVKVRELPAGRQSHGEAASALRIVGDIAGVPACNLPHQRQAEPGALRTAASGDPVES